MQPGDVRLLFSDKIEDRNPDDAKLEALGADLNDTIRMMCSSARNAISCARNRATMMRKARQIDFARWYVFFSYVFDVSSFLLVRGYVFVESLACLTYAYAFPAQFLLKVGGGVSLRDAFPYV